MRLSCALVIAFLAVCNAAPMKIQIVPVGKQYTYHFTTDFLVGTKEPIDFGSRFKYTGLLHLIGIKDNLIQFTLADLVYTIENGALKPENRQPKTPIPAEASALTLPFQVEYDSSGRLVSLRTDPKDMEWSINMKKSMAVNFEIGTIMQMDEKNTYVSVAEQTLYGKCNVNYQLMKMEAKEVSVFKNMDPVTCKNSFRLSEEKDFLSMDHGKYYTMVEKDGSFMIKYIGAEGGLIVHPKGMRNQNAFTTATQSIAFYKETDGTASECKEGTVHTMYKYQDPKEKCKDTPLQTAVDVTGGRHKVDSAILVQKVEQLLEMIIKYFDENRITMMKPEMKNINLVNQILFELETANLDVLEQIFVVLTEKSKTPAEHRKLDIYTELLPYIGTRASAILIRNLVRKNKIEDTKVVERILTNLPEQILCPTEKLLTELKDLLDLQSKSESLLETAALSYATLVKYTFEDVTEKSAALENYISMFAEKYANAPNFRKKLIYLECLGNIEVGSVLKRLLVLLQEEKETSLRIRILSLCINRLYEDVELMVRTVWPILTNRKEDTQLRLMAYFVYTMQKNPIVSRFMNLYWMMRHEPNEMIYSVHYNTMKALSKPSDMYENTQALADICKLVMRLSRKPMIQVNEGLYIYESVDKESGMGVRAEVMTLPDGKGHTQYGFQINRKFNTEITEMFSFYTVKDKESMYLSMHKDDRCAQILSLDTLDLEEVFGSIFSMISASFEGQQKDSIESIMIPLSSEKIIPSDIGTPIKLYDRTSVLLQLDGRLDKMENFELEFKWRSVQSLSMGMKAYNPLLNTWHGIQELKTMALNLPIDLSFDPQKDGFVLIIKSSNGSDNVIGAQFYGESQVFVENLMNKEDRELLGVGEATELFVKIGRENVKPNEKILIDEEFKEIGKSLKVKIFDCDRDISVDTMGRGDFMELIGKLFKHKTAAWNKPGMKSCGVAYQLAPIMDVAGLEVKFMEMSDNKAETNETFEFQFRSYTATNETVKLRKMVLSKPPKPWPVNKDEEMEIFGEFSTETGLKTEMTAKVTMGYSKFNVILDFKNLDEKPVNSFYYELISMRSDEQNNTKHIMSKQCKPELYLPNQLMPISRKCFMTETGFRKYTGKLQGTGADTKDISAMGELNFPLLRPLDLEFKMDNHEIVETMPEFLQNGFKSLFPPINIFFGTEAFDFAWSRHSCIVRPMFMMRENMMKEMIQVPKDWTPYFKHLHVNASDKYEVYIKMSEIKDSLAFRVVHNEEVIECEPTKDDFVCKLNGEVVSDPKYATIESKSFKRMVTANPPIVLVDNRNRGLLIVFDGRSVRIETSAYMRHQYGEGYEISGVCMEDKY